MKASLTVALAALLLLTGAKDKAPSVETLVGQLGACESLDSCAAVQELKKRGPSIWPDIQVGLKHPEEMTRYWTLGVLTMVVIPEAQEAIASRLTDKAVRIRAAAAFALGMQKGKKVAKWLIRAIGDEDVNVRYSAAIALGRVQDPAGVPALSKALRDKDIDVRKHAAVALGEIGDKRGTAPLIERLEQDMVPEVRGYVAMALGNLGDPKAKPVLLKHLKIEDDTKALAATIYAIGEFRDRATLPVLRPLAKHPNQDVRNFAQQTISLLEKLPAKP
ncbi:MAG: HEAT repeat domain-containing protein [Myxococcota bacterium]|nr:HEAT repeat domain-containing protein [Myxococcota bacterium]MEE2779656.1 HEAT repeat domain-containing protein [Myxococcota bacterium]